jgi:hypothetical protein
MTLTSRGVDAVRGARIVERGIVPQEPAEGLLEQRAARADAGPAELRRPEVEHFHLQGIAWLGARNENRLADRVAYKFARVHTDQSWQAYITVQEPGIAYAPKVTPSLLTRPSDILYVSSLSAPSG